MTTTSRARPACAALVALTVGASLALAAPADAAPADAAPAAAAAVPVRAGAPVAGLRAAAVTVRTGFSSPTQVTSAPDGRNRLYVVEQSGRIRVVAGSRVWTYVDLGGRVRGSGEQGLLGLAFSPRFAKDRRLFVTYTRGDGALVLGRLKARKASSRKVKASTLRTVLVVPHPTYTNHNGGSMAFGPDGFLYLGTGDGGGGGDPRHTAGSLRSLSGKILRLDVRQACGRTATASRGRTRTAARHLAAGRSCTVGCATPGGSPSTRPGGSGSGTWGRTGTRRSTRWRVARAGRTWAGRAGRAGTATTRRSAGAGPATPHRHRVPPGRSSCATSSAEAITGGYVYRGRRTPTAGRRLRVRRLGHRKIWAYRTARWPTVGRWRRSPGSARTTAGAVRRDLAGAVYRSAPDGLRTALPGGGQARGTDRLAEPEAGAS